MSFMHGGEQFIAVACGGNFQISYPLGDAVFIFGLPGKRGMMGAQSTGASADRGRNAMMKKKTGADTTGTNK
jgi:hypothetical protein